MTNCQHCHRPTQLYLCDDCQTLLANMLDELPWLIEELDTRIQKFDRISIGTIGRNRRPADQLDAIDFAAAEQARKLRHTLTRWVTTIAERHTGRPPAALSTVTTANLARWLRANVDAIARLDLAHKGRHPLVDDITRLVGAGQRGGELVTAINRQELRYFGPCTHTTGRDRQGRPRECGTDLIDDREAIELTCPTCHTVTPVRRQIITMSYRQRDDLFTERQLLKILREETELDNQPVVSRMRFYGWIRGGRLKPHGPRPRKYSLTQARQLRSEHQEANAQ